MNPSVVIHEPIGLGECSTAGSAPAFQILLVDGLSRYLSYRPEQSAGSTSSVSVTGQFAASRNAQLPSPLLSFRSQIFPAAVSAATCASSSASASSSTSLGFQDAPRLDEFSMLRNFSCCEIYSDTDEGTSISSNLRLFQGH